MSKMSDLHIEQQESGESHSSIVPVDIGNLCVHCRKDTSFGSGRFVNRYPVFGLENIDTGQEEDGYCCDECEQQFYRDNPIEAN
jgi:hypothetical protein